MEDYTILSTINKQLIKNINNGKNLEKELPAYVFTLAEQYQNQAVIRSAMQYYVMYEQYAEGMFVEKEVQETVNFIADMVANVFIQEADCNVEECIAKIEQERSNVIAKMEVLTNYTDQLMVYEYVLNRIEHKFDHAALEEDTAVFAQQLMQYIFGVKDNFVINEKIKEVISQLPVRMARSKFFELVKNSISLYKGGQKESLDSYLYMLRTSAMLYKPEAEGRFFADLGVFVDKLKSVDFDTLEQTAFEELQDELKEKAANIRYTSEMFLALQELINSLYVFVLMKKDLEDELIVKNHESEDLDLDKLKICGEIIAVIDGQMKQGDKEELPVHLEEMMCELEGTPERIAMTIQQLEGCLGLVKESYGAQLEQDGLATSFADLEKAQTLLSDSLFVEFKEAALEEVTDAMVEAETAKLVEEFTALFKQNSMRVIRAIIASTIAHMPVFFANTEEVSEYIMSSLEQCKDDAEKLASYEILCSVMEEDN